jgi:signal transduction histidine kinase
LEKKDKYGPLSRRQEKTLHRMLRNAKKIREMVYDLLEIGRSEAGYRTPERFNPARMVHETLLETLEIKMGAISEVLRKSRHAIQVAQQLAALGIYMDVTPDVKTLDIYQDPTKFRQIIRNLLNNALHYRNKRMDISLKRHDSQIRIDITDDGPGIAPEHHKAVFKRYSQMGAPPDLQRDGHGLGLAGSLALAVSLGGTIELSSLKGCGATFRLVLPVDIGRK